MNNFQELLRTNINRVGKSIHDARKKQELTLDDLAFITGIESANLSRIENGKRDPKLSTLFRIAEGLRLDLSTLFIPEPEPNEEIDNTNIFYGDKKI